MSVKRSVQDRGFFKRLCLLGCVLLLMSSGICASRAQADVAVAGDLLVNLDSTSLTVGELASWTNAGTLEGTFGSSTKNPVVESVQGVSAVTFADSAWLKSDFLTTADFTGSSDWSVEIWAFNPSIGGDEGMMTWSNRGEENKNAAFCYSTAPVWGAFAGWGAGDIGYGNAVAPVAGIWHHIAYTYAGGANGLFTIYVDGQQNNQGQKSLDIHGPAELPTSQAMPVILGGSTGGDATGLAANATEQWFSGSISKVRIHGGLLTAEQVKNNYDTEKAAYLSPALTIPQPAPASLDFGVVAPEAGQSPVQTITIRNVGTGDLTFNTPAVSLTGANPEQFVVVDLDTTPLAPGASREVKVACDSTTTSLLKAQLAFNTNSPLNPTVALWAMGSKPEAQAQAGDL
ncbi:MAG TPA: choice-of-anchor D domain-containing protein, partial [Candidatus Sumerlaeota bacterium]|nr:choice-of-anchor D domain-containing protein [Candidatus Sumerlaeota bacterium]